MKLDLEKNVTGKEILDLFYLYIERYEGNINALFNNISILESSNEFSLIWKKNNTLEERISNKKFAIIITELESEFENISESLVIYSKKSRLLFVKIINTFFNEESISNELNIHETAIIHPGAKLGKNVFIGPYCIIEKNVEIGDNVFIEAHVYISKNVSIGSNCRIYSHTKIGTTALNYTKDIDGVMVRFPSKGKLIIEDFVDIGSNVTITQSGFSKTVIGYQTKINGNSFIGSNVVIGERNYLSASVTICGSVNIGNDNFIGASSVIRNKMYIGNDNTIGAGAVVVKSCSDNNVLTGNPAFVNVKSKGEKI